MGGMLLAPFASQRIVCTLVAQFGPFSQTVRKDFRKVSVGCVPVASRVEGLKKLFHLATEMIGDCWFNFSTTKRIRTSRLML